MSTPTSTARSVRKAMTNGPTYIELTLTLLPQSPSMHSTWKNLSSEQLLQIISQACGQQYGVVGALSMNDIHVVAIEHAPESLQMMQSAGTLSFLCQIVLPQFLTQSLITALIGFGSCFDMPCRFTISKVTSDPMLSTMPQHWYEDLI